MITLTNVFFKYPSTKFCLDNINLTFLDNKIYVVTGKNGSGKSTLIQLVSGIIKQNKGQILLNGSQLQSSLKNNEVKIGIVFQNPDNQIIFNNVYNDICFTLKNYNIPKIEFEDRINYALSTVKMLEYKHKETINLSSGQKQRIAIANMIALKPQIIIFDESTSLLDPSSKQDMYAIFKKLKNDGLTIIYTTNILEEIVYADEIIIMKNGKVEYFNEIKNVLKNIVIFENLDIYVPAKIKIINKLIISNKLTNFDDESLLQALGVN